MSISEEDIARVREASDLVAIVGERAPLRQKGRDFWCCCPFHSEKTPSCKIDPSTQLWHCFGCGEGGDVFGFVMKMDDLSFPDAVRYLADRAHIDIVETGGRASVPQGVKARLKEVCRASAEFFHEQLMRGKGAGQDSARAYLAGRGLGGSVPKTWQLGYAPGSGRLVRHLGALGFSSDDMVAANVAVERNGRVTDRFYERVMFPILDAQGDVIAFGGRVVGSGEPKYLNSQETPLFHKSQVLYGLDKAKAAMAATGQAVVVEGYTDVIALSEAGLKNVVATLGTALTSQHIRLLRRHARKSIVYLFDGDEAGQRAIDRALAFVGSAVKRDPANGTLAVLDVQLLAVTLPDGLDPAEFVEARGADALRALIADAKPLIEFGIERRLSQADLSTAQGRAAGFASALSVLAPIKDTNEAVSYLREIAVRTRVDENDARRALRQLKAPRTPGQDDAPDPAPAPAAPAQPASPAERDRLRHESELLALSAQNPQLALAHADALAQTRWHDESNARLAACLLQVLSEDPAAQPGRIVTSAARIDPAGAARLSAAADSDEQDPEARIAYLVERLAVDDLGDAVKELQAQIAACGPDDEEQVELLWGAAAELQREYNARLRALRGLERR